MENWLLMKRFCLIALFAIFAVGKTYGLGITGYSQLQGKLDPTGAGIVYVDGKQFKIGDEDPATQESMHRC